MFFVIFLNLNINFYFYILVGLCLSIYNFLGFDFFSFFGSLFKWLVCVFRYFFIMYGVLGLLKCVCLCIIVIILIRVILKLDLFICNVFYFELWGKSWFFNLVN